MSGKKGHQSGYLRRADIILIFSSVLVAALLLLAGLIFKPGTSEDPVVRVYRDGNLIHECPLDSLNRVSLTDPDLGENILSVSGVGVCIESADCPGQDCVKAGVITQPGEEIICLPHRLVVRIENGEQQTDVVVY